MKRTGFASGILVTLFSAILVLTMAPPAWADVSGSYEYSIDNGQATITKYNGSSATVSVPSSLGGYPVTNIAKYAFSGNDSITTVTIPSTVTSIESPAFSNCLSLREFKVDGDNSGYIAVSGVLLSRDLTELVAYPNARGSSYSIPDTVTSVADGAFSWCMSLTYISIPNSVRQIGDNAFERCSFQTVVLPSSVSSIGDWAFAYCGNLSSVQIPDSTMSLGSFVFWGCGSLSSVSISGSLTSIGEGAFAACDSLRSFSVADENPAYTAVDGVLMSKDQTTLVSYPKAKGNTYVIPDTVTIIESHAFYGCSALSSIAIPDSVTTIGNNAFLNCTSLSSVALPGSLESIGDGAFMFCEALGSIAIPDSVTSIGEDAFLGCKSFSKIVIPDSVTSLGNRAFSQCSNLISVDLPNTISSIGDYTFNNCPSLAIITIPDSVTTIGNNAFSGCSSLTSITIPDSVTSLGNNVFQSCTRLTSVAIPNSVTSIGNQAFDRCSSLISVTIPESVTSLGDLAFYRCSSLRSVSLPSSLTKIGDKMFEECTSLQSISIPSSVTAIGRDAFLYCTSLKNVAIPDSVTSIGFGAFEQCSSLKTVEMSDAVTAIGDYAFYGLASQSIIRVRSDRVAGLLEGKYSVGATTVLVIRDMADTDVAPIEDQPYTGQAVQPTLVVSFRDEMLEAGKDYEVVFENNVEPGIAAVTISGRNRFYGSKTVTFNIFVRNLEDAIIGPIADRVYNGTPQEPELTVSYGGLVLRAGQDYEAFYADNEESGLAIVTIEGRRAFSGTNSATFYIAQRDLSDAIISPIPDAVFDGTPQEPEFSVTVDGRPLKGGEDYDVSYADNVLPGTATATVTGKGNYAGESSASFSIVGSGEILPVVDGNGDWLRTDGTPYRIVSASDSDFILDVAEVRPTAGANVSIWTSNGGSNQLFTFEQSDDGYVVLRNVANDGLVLDAAGATPKIGANVSTWTYNGGMNQKWALVPSEEHPGLYSIASASNPDFVLDAAGAAPKIGANVSIWTSNGGMNQLWAFVPANDLAYADVAVSGMERNVTGSGLAPDIAVTLNGEELVEGEDYVVLFDGSDDRPAAPGAYEVSIGGIGSCSGTVELGVFSIYEVPEAADGAEYHLASGFSDDYVLDVAAAMPVIGANVSIWTDNGGANQLFTLELGDDGYYVLRNVANPLLVLDAAGAVPKVGANVSTWSYNEGMNQKWVLIPSEDRPGYYRVASASDTGYVLDAAGAAPKAGANVSIWYDNGGPNQLWKLVA